MDLDGGPSIERWTEAAWKGKPAKARGWAARAAFQEFGVRISYLDEAGAVRVFEPTPEQTARWEDKRKTLADFKAVRQKVAAKAAKSAWEGKAYLASLGGVFVFGSIGLLRRRKPPIAGNPSAHQE